MEVVVFERQGVEKLYVLVEWAGDTVMVGSEMHIICYIYCRENKSESTKNCQL